MFSRKTKKRSISNEGINCDICGFSLFFVLHEKRYENSNAQILKCQKCGMIFIYPQFPASQDQTSTCQHEITPKQSDLKKLEEKVEIMKSSLARLVLEECYNYPRIRKKRNFFLRQIAKILNLSFLRNTLCFRGEGKLLDIGCNNGLQLSLLKKLGWNVRGVEIDRGACEHARKLGLDVFCGNLEEAGFPSGFFDVVRIVQVIEHVPSPCTTFKEISRIIKPDGVLYLETPNGKSFASKCFGTHWLDPEGHIWAFSVRSMQFLAEKTGLYVKRVHFKSSKGITSDALKYFLKGTIFYPYWKFVLSNKNMLRLIANITRFFLNIYHISDILVIELGKKPVIDTG